MKDFKAMGLLPTILKAIEAQGYEKPTPIQQKAIPHLLNGSDLLGIAQTGTGKTGAFSLPIIQHLLNNPLKVQSKHTRALILTPTRELASQIEANIKSYSVDSNLKTRVVFGGVSQNPQIRAMKQGVDILIATPGRLLDLMEQGYVKYNQLEICVLDEADRMLDMGFSKDVHKIIAKLPVKKQTLLFSATMPKDISVLAKKLLKNPEKIEVTPAATTVEKIEQTINHVAKSNKILLLKSILEDESIKSVLVFTKTKHMANRVAKNLEASETAAAAIHGNKSQNQRENALKDFRDGKIRVLVATDIAARGIDVDKITHVINFDLPNVPESYVHRIGRTARAGREGVAISFCDPEEKKLLKDIEKLIKFNITVNMDHPYHGVPGKKPVVNTSANKAKSTKKKARKPSQTRTKKKQASRKPSNRNKTKVRPPNKKPKQVRGRGR
jgi:ATP-dependent RNA helicase RhlE